MRSAKMRKSSSYQNHHCSLIFYFIIISCCCPYVSCYSINASATSSSPTLACLPNQHSALLQFKQEFAFFKPNFASYRFLCSIYPNSYYNDTYDHESYPKMKFWKAETDCCSWDGVTCDFKTGKVVGLDLSNSWLQGPLHSNSSLFKLLQLQEINLSFNNFSFSPIPSEFSQLPRLTHLNLSFSMFFGNIPSEISFLTNLVSLGLSSFKKYDESSLLCLRPKDFTSIIQNMTNLRRLHLRQVNISSLVPGSLSNLSSLTSLGLDGCSLYGKFPENIFQLPKLQIIYLPCNYLLSGFLPQFQPNSSLRWLHLDNTKFSGKLPNSIGYLTSLYKLSLWNCSFTGPIPSSIWNLTQLTYLDLSWNHLNGHELPTKLGNLPKLSVIGLQSCQFGGEIPALLGNLTRLEYLSLSSNSFSGQIPASLGNLKQLQHLNLSNNGLRGQIPASFGNLIQLKILSLSFNSFSRQIPASIGNLTQLKVLYLSLNNLDGVIPSFLFIMPSLSDLYLDYNQFTGSLCIQNISSSRMEFLSLGENKLHGQIPQTMFKLLNLVYLSLEFNNLSGTVELSNFSKFGKLRYLFLSSNSLSITKVSANSKFPKLRQLSLGSCNITEFPDFLKTQDELELLVLSDNRIEDQIPKWFWSAIGKMKLAFLDMSGNQLQGSLTVPPLSISYFSISSNNLTGRIHPSFRKLTKLETLDISHNHFSGTIPSWLGNLSSYLEVLNIRGNNFEGSLHQVFRYGSMHNLKILDLSHNHFQGQIPESLINCRKLQILNLGNNQISDIFPFWLQNLPELQVLVLRSNKLYGSIWHPHKFWEFVNLHIIDLAFNNFNGSLPSEFFRNWDCMIKDVDGNKTHMSYLSLVNYLIEYYVMVFMNKGVEIEDNRIPVTFKYIDLSNNRFDGEIPSSIGDLRSLIMLNLSSNSFTGPIPLSIGNMRELESLDLSKNKLSGRIPLQLTNLSFLAYLNLSQNQLTGPIPQGGQLDTFTSSCFEENPGLCGSQLSNKCDAKETPISYQNNELESEDCFTWKAVVMGYGCGLMVGFIIGYVTLFRQGPTGLFWTSSMRRYIYARW